MVVLVSPVSPVSFLPVRTMTSVARLASLRYMELLTQLFVIRLTGSPVNPSEATARRTNSTSRIVGCSILVRLRRVPSVRTPFASMKLRDLRHPRGVARPEFGAASIASASRMG